MNEHVLDASAIMALLLRERGWHLVEQVEQRVVSSVNFAEACSSMLNKGYQFPRAVAYLTSQEFQVIPFDEAQAIEVARLRPITRAFGLSLGDRACLALASLRGLPILTSDRAWIEAAPHLAITCIR